MPPDMIAKEEYRGICAAVATPPGQSGIAVIRLSGPRCAQAVDELFRPRSASQCPVAQMDGYRCAYGRLLDPETGELIDEVVVTRFVSPHSYTGEDVVEISCHGGYGVKTGILDRLLALGIQPASPGEFTQRAFLNGKLDLVQAEAVMDLIAAGAQKASRAAAAQLGGKLSRRVRGIAEDLYAVLAQVEMLLEFPEEDEDAPMQSSFKTPLQSLIDSMEHLASSFKQGRMLREGMTVVIAGRPNAGKSSLLNALAGFDRAIVTATPGTTRDTVEELVDVEGIPVRLVDTAGLRDSQDDIERQGVQRARKALSQADLVFWLISPPLQDLAAEKETMEQAASAPVIVVAGKEDLEGSRALHEAIAKTFNRHSVLTFSAMRPQGIRPIREAILRQYHKAGSAAKEDLLVTNRRHQDCLLQAAKTLRHAMEALDQPVPLDMVASLIRAAAETLAQITGDQVSEELVDTIFSRFCVGK